MHNMMLKGELENLEVMSLIGSGNTHNFVSENVVRWFNLSIENRNGLNIVVSN